MLIETCVADYFVSDFQFKFNRIAADGDLNEEETLQTTGE